MLGPVLVHNSAAAIVYDKLFDFVHRNVGQPVGNKQCHVLVGGTDIQIPEKIATMDPDEDEVINVGSLWDRYSKATKKYQKYTKVM
jgi:hypothetical protein